jgi:hypothetical protein
MRRSLTITAMFDAPALAAQGPGVGQGSASAFQQFCAGAIVAQRM